MHWVIYIYNNPDPTLPSYSRISGNGVSPRLPESGPSTTHLAAPVELPMSVVPVEQLALKSKATSPEEHQIIGPHHRHLGTEFMVRARRHISPLVETISELPSKSPSKHWQKLGKEMGEINLGLVNEKETTATLMLIHIHEDLYQQVYIDRSVSNVICHALQRSLLGEEYLDLVASLISLQKRCPWLQIRSRP